MPFYTPFPEPISTAKTYSTILGHAGAHIYFRSLFCKDWAHGLENGEKEELASDERIKEGVGIAHRRMNGWVVER